MSGQARSGRGHWQAGHDLASVAGGPMGLKKRLASEITAQFHDGHAADAAQDNFERVVQGRGLPDDIPDFVEPSLARSDDAEGRRLSNIIFESGLASSTTEAKRLIRQGAIAAINDSTGETRKLDRDDRIAQLSFEQRIILKRGNRRFVRLVGQ